MDGKGSTLGPSDIGVDAIGPHGTADCVYALSSFIKRQGFQIRCHEVSSAVDAPKSSIATAAAASMDLPPLVRMQQMAIQAIPSPAATAASTAASPRPHGAGYAGRESFKAPRLFPDLKARWFAAGGVPPKPAPVPTTAPAQQVPAVGGPSASSAASSEIKQPETTKQATGHAGGSRARAPAQAPAPAGAYPTPMQALSAPWSST